MSCSLLSALPPSWAMVGKNRLSQGFSIVINTFQRDTCLKNVIEHYQACSQLQQIRVVWNEPERAIPPWLTELELTSAVQVVVDRNEGSELTNRFKPKDFLTEAVFSQDDDLQYSCEILHAAYKVWEKHPDKVVGFVPRLVDPAIPDSEFGKSSWNSAWLRGRTNLVLPTKGSFLRQSWFAEYFDPSLASLRNIVNKANTGEDIMMAMLHAHRTKVAPLPLLVPEEGGHELDLQCGRSALTDCKEGDHCSKQGRARVTLELSEAFAHPLLETEQFVNPLMKSAVIIGPDETSKYKKF